MKFGALIQLVNEKDEVYLWDNPSMSTHVDCEVIYIWTSSMLGIVLDIAEYYIPRHLMPPGEEYFPVKVIVNDKVGWTYSDYVKMVE